MSPFMIIKIKYSRKYLQVLPKYHLILQRNSSDIYYHNNSSVSALLQVDQTLFF